ncbi:hypothetical protein DL766_003442 [Monosporascus sp. MC13-8B]|uniref:Uncharacterized protein n=1 Tax=Monosporascus cannonballus TaxID=155416 RepID=A0ABY0HG65_9PEZI|nr:hypothetical protein DL762_001438 [Monosporascus cannonballus]RYP33522.1 hypothetical protein DL766_003442 [Monosporascus sp. MC13-8B]
MAVDAPRPSTSGSARPSRFQEGSMNDRVSTVPPLEFLGPEEIRAYEAQFFVDPARAAVPRKQRPVSDSATLSVLQDQQQQPGLIKKKSFRFFARVRDALSWTSRSDASSSSSFSSSSESQADEENAKRKHSTLPEPYSSSMSQASPKRPHLRQKSQSSVHVPRARSVGSDAAGKAGLQHHPSVGNLSDRPTKEEIMQSYNELVASGFFKAHAIQSTRRPPPGSAAPRPPHPPSSLHNQPHHPQHQTNAPAHPHLPTIPSVGSGLEQQQQEGEQPQEARQTKSQPRHIPSHIALAAAIPSSPKRAPPLPPSPAVAATGPKEPQRSKLTGSLKRSRSSTDDGTTSSSRSSSDVQAAARASSSTTSTPTSPLKRVAKKLRKMPSSIAATTASMTSSAKAATASNQAAMVAADGMVYLHQTERPVRLREPSPAPPEVTTTTVSSPTSKLHRRSSGFLRKSGPGKVSPGRGAGGNRLGKRGRPPTPPPRAPWQFRSSSPSRRKAKAGPPVSMPLSLSVPAAPTSGPGCCANADIHNLNFGLGHDESGERFMSPDRVPPRDSSLRGGGCGGGRARRGSSGYFAVTTYTTDTNTDDTHTTTTNALTAMTAAAWVSPPKAVPRQLSILPDANRGIPSVPRIPDHYYYYHQQKQPRGSTEVDPGLVDENRMQVDWQYGQAL